MHPTRAAGLAASRSVVEAVRAGSGLRWADLGYAGSSASVFEGQHVGGPRSDADAVAAIQGDPKTVALVRADALGPGIGVVPVDGTDPVTAPESYPVTVAADDADVLPDRVVSTLWVGDIMLGRRVGQAITAARDVSLPFHETADRLRAADLTVGNLECTMSRNGRPTQGGDSFAGDPSFLSGVRDAGFDVIVLANNHLGDYGQTALSESVRAVSGAGFATVGAGENLAAALEPAVVERRGVRFAVVAFNAIGETPAATDSSSGAASVGMPPRTGPVDEFALRRITDTIAAARQRADVVLAYPHWGQQYTHEPVPEQRTVAHRLIDAGADAVIGTHPHWVQGMDLYQGRLVAHSLGNFVFDMTFSTQVQQGVALELVFWGNRAMGARLLPLRIGDRYMPQFLDGGDEAAQIRSDVWRASTGPFAA